MSNDSIVASPAHVQWIGRPKWARSHEHLASISAVVASGGRVFYILDDGPIESIEFPAKWVLVARDGFNGVILWKRPLGRWQDHLRRFRSGPTQLPRRLVAVGDRVYVTLGYGEPVSALDAASGEPAWSFNAHLRYVITADGRNKNFVDKRTGRDYCDRAGLVPVLELQVGNEWEPVTACQRSGETIIVRFGQAGAATIRLMTKDRYFVFELVSLDNREATQLNWVNLWLDISENIGTVLNVAGNDEFAACLLALNLQVDSHGRSVHRARLVATCQRDYGFVGAKVALIWCPASSGVASTDMTEGDFCVKSAVGENVCAFLVCPIELRTFISCGPDADGFLLPWPRQSGLPATAPPRREGSPW